MAGRISSRHVVLTGPPGVGKTTLIRKVCERLGDGSCLMKGFYTEEVRAGGRRVGFDVVTLDGQRGELARVSETGGEIGRREFRVGQYRVNLHSFEQTALPTLQNKDTASQVLFVVDEIGKMELFSACFVQTVRHLLNSQNAVVFATIPVPKGRPIPLVEEVRNRKDATLFTVTKENRDSILGEVLKAVKSSCEKT